ncbi:MAG: NAD-dependent epimerase/dehydratase family protein [Nitrospira sp.]|nr:NAD-dependent epimerase/dehydratase family protein [Nitrospira sp.]
MNATSTDNGLGTLIITGSSGRIGRSFIARIGDRFIEMGFDRKGPPHPPADTEHIIDCDLSSDDSVSDALNNVRRLGHTRITSVIHLAAYYSFSGEPSTLYEQVTVRGTERLLHGLRDFEVEQFIFSSTMLVHAPCKPGERIHEDWPLMPKWDYPKSKVRTEQLIMRERGDMPVVLMRIAGVYDDRCHSIPITHQIKRIYEQRFVGRLYSGDLTHGAAFLHMDDMVDALVLAVEHRKDLPPVTTLLIGEPDTLSYDDLQRIISRRLHGHEWTTYRIPKPVAKLGAWFQTLVPGADPFIKPWMIDIADDHYALDISRARTLLGWSPRHSLRETIPKMLTDLQSDPISWYRENEVSPKIASHGPSWPHVANMLLGLWLIGTVPALGTNETALFWSDLWSGAAILLFSGLAVRHAWAAWTVCGAGLWVMSAPLVFSASNAAVYNNDLVVGALVVTFAGIVPHFDRDGSGSGAPPGWSYNPSGWVQRLAIVFLAMIGFFLARYMAAFQLGHIVYPWDPFFGESTRRVLTSDVSKAFPVSDAGLGALSYLLDALAGLIGGIRRWRTMPWMVVLFGVFIIPPGVTSIVLVMLQPISIGDWCTLCLMASVVMLLMVAPALDEVIATGQFLLRVRRRGENMWRVFWHGESSAMDEPETPTRSLLAEMLHSVEAFSAPWNLWLSTAVGIWLMAAPTLLDLVGAVADSAHIVGALVVTFSVVAFAEPARLVRMLTILCGAWLLFAAWLLESGIPGWPWISAVSGLALMVLNLRCGPVEDRYGDWQKVIR